MSENFEQHKSMENLPSDQDYQDLSDIEPYSEMETCSNTIADSKTKIQNDLSVARDILDGRREAEKQAIDSLWEGKTLLTISISNAKKYSIIKSVHFDFHR